MVIGARTHYYPKVVANMLPNLMIIVVQNAMATYAECCREVSRDVLQIFCHECIREAVCVLVKIDVVF